MSAFALGAVVGVGIGGLVWQAMKPRSLVVLDLNGLLVHREYVRESMGKNPHFVLGNFNIWIRPGTDVFLDWLFESYDVGVWTSAQQHNALGLVDIVFKDRAPLFVWCQDMCDNLGERSFHKTISKIYDTYPLRNVLLIDDDASKTRLNPPDSCLNTEPWSRELVNDKGLEDLKTAIMEHFKQF